MNQGTQAARQPSLPQRGAVLPAVNLTDLATGAAVSLRSGRGPRVLLAPHDGACPDCVAWVNALAADGRARDEWGARIAVVLRHDDDAGGTLLDSLADTVRLLRDDGSLLQLPPAAIVVLDEWGEVYLAMQLDAEHTLPDPDEVAEWSRYIAIQCPECEQPEGDWRTL